MRPGDLNKAEQQNLSNIHKKLRNSLKIFKDNVFYFVCLITYSVSWKYILLYLGMHSISCE